MITNLIIMLPYYSHIVPTFGIMSQLKGNNNRVIYANLRTYESLIIIEKFEFVPFNYLLEYRVRNIKHFFEILLISMINANFNVKRFSDFIKFSFQIEELLTKINPDVIYLDEYIAEYYFFFKLHKKKVIILNTRCSSLKKKNFPPLSSSFLPRNNILSIIYCEFLWFKLFVAQRACDYMYFFCFLGWSEISFWKRISRKNKWEYKNIISLNHCLNKSIKEIETINLVPLSIEFPNVKIGVMERYFYKEYKVSMNSESYEIYLKLKAEILFQKNEGKKIIITSFGTLYFQHSKKVEKLISSIINIVSKLHHIYLIVVSDKRYLNYRNIKIVNSIPLSHLLKNIHLIINHGGIGTIKECIENETPMIVAPLSCFTDQNGCSARVVANNYGKRININNYTDKLLKQLILDYLPE